MKSRFVVLVACVVAAATTYAGAKSPKQSAKPAGPSIKRMPGSWESEFKWVRYDATGVTDDYGKQVVRAGQAQVGKTEKGDPVCITAQTAVKDTLDHRIWQGVTMGEEWKTSRKSVVNGRLDFETAMSDPDGTRARLMIKGEITPTLTRLFRKTITDLPGGGHLEMEEQQLLKRTGPCTPGQVESD